MWQAHTTIHHTHREWIVNTLWVKSHVIKTAPKNTSHIETQFNPFGKIYFRQDKDSVEYGNGESNDSQYI